MCWFGLNMFKQNPNVYMANILFEQVPRFDIEQCPIHLRCSRRPNTIWGKYFALQKLSILCCKYNIYICIWCRVVFLYLFQGGDKAELFAWITESVIPNLYHTHDYNDMELSQYNSKFISNSYAMRLGPPRLRQLRVQPGKFNMNRHGICIPYFIMSFTLREDIWQFYFFFHIVDISICNIFGFTHT